jgi:hypothetical protein
MFRYAFRRRLLTLGVALMVALPLCAAASPEARSAQRAAITASGPSTLLSDLWQRLTGMWAEIGCTIDPNGHCIPQSQGYIGCTFDPDGHCISGPNATHSQSDIGCTIDPSGGPCVPRQ